MKIECPSCGRICEHTELSEGRYCSDPDEDCTYEFTGDDVLWCWLEQHGLTNKQRYEILGILVTMKLV